MWWAKTYRHERSIYIYFLYTVRMILYRTRNIGKRWKMVTQCYGCRRSRRCFGDYDRGYKGSISLAETNRRTLLDREPRVRVIKLAIPCIGMAHGGFSLLVTTLSIRERRLAHYDLGWVLATPTHVGHAVAHTAATLHTDHFIRVSPHTHSHIGGRSMNTSSGKVVTHS